MMDAALFYSACFALMAEQMGPYVLEEKLEEWAQEVEMAELQATLQPVRKPGSLPPAPDQDMLDLMALEPPARRIRHREPKEPE